MGALFSLGLRFGPRLKFVPRHKCAASLDFVVLIEPPFVRPNFCDGVVLTHALEGFVVDVGCVNPKSLRQFAFDRQGSVLSCVPPSIVPQDAERDTYLVLEDFGGRLGRAWRETDAESADRATLIRDLLDGPMTMACQRPTTH
jgi:hypothetical protein